VLEIRESESKGSINQHGHYQTRVVAVEANVKDSTRFPKGGWAFFDVGTDVNKKSIAAIPAGNRCEQCHSAHGATDSTFVQFYPELAAIAKKFGTYKDSTVPEQRH
jgi:hypothetical protein